METESLYFASATQFVDKFEGAITILLPGSPVKPRALQYPQGDWAFEQLKRLTKINCWHKATYESDAMWQLYAGQWKGIAICTTPERIQAARKSYKLQPEFADEEMYCGNVEYLDLTEVEMKVSMLDRFFFKHLAFAWEREFRLAISLRIAEESGVQVPESGIPVKFDLDILIEKIILGSSLEKDDVRLIANAASKTGLENRICQSSLRGIPRYSSY